MFALPTALVDALGISRNAFPASTHRQTEKEEEEKQGGRRRSRSGGRLWLPHWRSPRTRNSPERAENALARLEIFHPDVADDSKWTEPLRVSLVQQTPAETVLRVALGSDVWLEVPVDGAMLAELETVQQPFFHDARGQATKHGEHDPVSAEDKAGKQPKHHKTKRRGRKPPSSSLLGAELAHRGRGGDSSDSPASVSKHTPTRPRSRSASFADASAVSCAFRLSHPLLRGRADDGGAHGVASKGEEEGSSQRVLGLPELLSVLPSSESFCISLRASNVQEAQRWVHALQSARTAAIAFEDAQCWASDVRAIRAADRHILLPRFVFSSVTAVQFASTVTVSTPSTSRSELVVVVSALAVPVSDVLSGDSSLDDDRKPVAVRGEKNIAGRSSAAVQQFVVHRSWAHLESLWRRLTIEFPEFSIGALPAVPDDAVDMKSSSSKRKSTVISQLPVVAKLVSPLLKSRRVCASPSMREFLGLCIPNDAEGLGCAPHPSLVRVAVRPETIFQLYGRHDTPAAAIGSHAVLCDHRGNPVSDAVMSSAPVQFSDLAHGQRGQRKLGDWFWFEVPRGDDYSVRLTLRGFQLVAVGRGQVEWRAESFLTGLCVAIILPLGSVPRNGLAIRHWFPLRDVNRDTVQRGASQVVGGFVDIQSGLQSGPARRTAASMLVAMMCSSGSMPLQYVNDSRDPVAESQLTAVTRDMDQSCTLHGGSSSRSTGHHDEDLLAGEVTFSTTLFPPTDRWQGSLNVALENAKNLDAHDFSGKSDPYFVLALQREEPHEPLRRKQHSRGGLHSTEDDIVPRQKSTIIKQSLNPSYDGEVFSFVIPAGADMSELKLGLWCWDWNQVRCFFSRFLAVFLHCVR
jgi:C2 domain